MAWLAVTCLALTACGDEPAGTAADPTADPVDRYTTTATVIEARGHLPQLCTSVMESRPPQCGPGGIDLIGWDWTGLDGSETTEAGVTWGDYVVIGTYDGERFTITESPMPYVAPEPTPEPPPATTPCPPPPDGWGVVDAATATAEAWNAAVAYAEAQPDYAAVWADSLVLNVRFTGNLERHERALRAIWGGALCVSSGERTAAELDGLRAALSDELDPLGSSVDERAGQVVLQVVVDDGLQQRLDQHYGPGLVRIHALLTPVN